MTDLLTYIESQQRGETGANRAAEHADAVSPNWSERAEVHLLDYAKNVLYGGGFLAEDARERAYGLGLERPPDSRAWGAVIKRAAKKGLIVKVGFAPARSSNCSAKVLWRAA